MELDPVFVKALRLLHSKSKDSTSQLKALYDDAVRARKGLALSPGSPLRKPEMTHRSREGLDKLKRDLIDLVPSKRSRLGSPGFSSSKSHTPSPTPPGSRGDPSGGNSSCDDMTTTMSGNDLEMNFDTLTCFVCKSFNQENGNKLMECHTCQNLYHQECHSPAVSNEDANDPRLIWHCTSCSKTLKRVSPPVKSSSSSSSSSSKSGSKVSGSSGNRPSPSKSTLETTSNNLFKRVSESSKGGLNGGGKPSGMAVLAASYKPGVSGGSGGGNGGSRSSSRNPGSSSSSNAGNSSKSSSNMSAADKRLAMMKKKAAAARKK